MTRGLLVSLASLALPVVATSADAYIYWHSHDSGGPPTRGDNCDGGDGTDSTNRGCEIKTSIP